MIQINLIPDVKREFIHAQKMRRATISISILVGIAAVGIIIALALVLGSQAIYQATLSSSIDSEYKKLSGTENINTALTIQNQLQTVSSLNGKKSIDSRLLDVLAAINPAAPNDIKIAKVTLNPTDKQVTIEGSAANGYTATDIFRKTILNTSVVSRASSDTSGKTTDTPLSSEVVIKDTSYGQDSTGQRVVRFTAVLTYPDGLFDNTTTDVRIRTVDAKIDVTDSKSRIPDSLFSAPAKSEGGE